MRHGILDEQLRLPCSLQELTSLTKLLRLCLCPYRLERSCFREVCVSMAGCDDGNEGSLNLILKGS